MGTKSVCVLALLLICLSHRADGESCSCTSSRCVTYEYTVVSTDDCQPSLHGDGYGNIGCCNQCPTGSHFENDEGLITYSNPGMPCELYPGQTETETCNWNCVDDITRIPKTLAPTAKPTKKPTKLKISKLSLNNFDGEPLRYLSASPHTYFQGYTVVHGTITITGDKGAKINNVKLDVIEGGKVVSSPEVVSGIRSKLYVTLGKSGVVSIATRALLFRIPSGDFSAVDQEANGKLVLRVRVKSSKGSAESPKTVTKLVKYRGTNRCGKRDEEFGGDDWVKPSVASLLLTVEGTLWGDMSKMNGGTFGTLTNPQHQTHMVGNSVDGKYADGSYPVRSAATAAMMISYLDKYSFRIRRVYVLFTAPFKQAIKNVILQDGCPVEKIVRNVQDHDTHFHWEVTDSMGKKCGGN